MAAPVAVDRWLDQEDEVAVPHNFLHIFSCRQNGCLPSIGTAEGEERFIDSLGFEPIYPFGTIHAFKPLEEFEDVQWAGQYDPNNYDRLELGDFADAEIPAQTTKWANIISDIYNAAFEMFRKDDRPNQMHLYRAMKDRKIEQYNPERLKWMMMQSSPIPHDLLDQNDQDIAEDLLSIFAKGFGLCQGYSIPRFLRQSVPNIGVVAGFGLAHTSRGKGTTGFTMAPAEVSDDNLPSGVPHCLVYGVSNIQDMQDRSRQRYREIRKRPSDRSRSNSGDRRTDDMDELAEDEAEADDVVEGGPKGLNFVNRERLLEAVNQGDPGNFFVNVANIAKFTESHKPDAMLIHYFDRSRPSVTGFEVKLVLEIASIYRYGDVSFPSHVRKATSQCVWSCLAALQQNQTKILGLCALINGFKLIKIVKNGHSWRVFESEVASFENGDGIVKFLCTLNEELALD